MIEFAKFRSRQYSAVPQISLMSNSMLSTRGSLSMRSLSSFVVLVVVTRSKSWLKIGTFSGSGSKVGRFRSLSYKAIMPRMMRSTSSAWYGRSPANREGAVTPNSGVGCSKLGIFAEGESEKRWVSDSTLSTHDHAGLFILFIKVFCRA